MVDLKTGVRAGRQIDLHETSVMQKSRIECHGTARGLPWKAKDPEAVEEIAPAIPYVIKMTMNRIKLTILGLTRHDH